MKKIGFDFPAVPRKTALFEAEDWYQKLLSEKLDRPYQPIVRSNFGQYDMAVNYLTSVLEEAKAVEKMAVYNIDHMAQIRFYKKDACALLNRVLPANIEAMKIGQCKYTLLLNENGGVIDDLIVMRESQESFILVINAGHDITGKGIDHGHEVEFLSDADYILKYKKDEEEVEVEDISEALCKIDIQGPLCFKAVKQLYGEDVMKNRNKPEKNMGFFSFNEFEYENEKFIISRTGYTNRWGFELYIPVKLAVQEFKRIANLALELGGLVVGLGGRDENRISAGAVGLPLNGSEYTPNHTPVNSPLFNAAFDMNKDFVGKSALNLDETKMMGIVITEGISVGRGVYLNDERIGTCTSSINSPNVSLEQRLEIGSKRKNVNAEEGVCAIGLAWLKFNPNQNNETPTNIKLEFYREDENKNKIGRPTLGYLAVNGVSPATASKPLKKIASL